MFLPAGSAHDAYIEIRKIIQLATTEILIVDSYVDGTLWQQLTNVPPTTKIRIMTMQMKGDFALEGRKFAAQHGNTIPSINPAAVETITGRGDFSVFAGMLNGLLLNWSTTRHRAI